MPRDGAIVFSDLIGKLDLIRVACDKCGRKGQYRKQNLIARYGADIWLPDLRAGIAQCSRHGQIHDACGSSLRRFGDAARDFVQRACEALTRVYQAL